MNHERRNVSSALHLFQRAVEQSASAFLLIDRNGVVEYVNPSFTSITQYSADEVRNRRLSELPALENLSELLFDARSALTQQNSWQGEFRSRRKNHEPYWGQLSLSKVYDDLGELTHYIGIYEDITQNKLAQQHIEKLAYRDNLTGLANRHYFIGALEERLESSGDRPLSLLLVDIDNFKRINDSLGHQTGDKLLVSLARRLRSCLGDGATPGALRQQRVRRAARRHRGGKGRKHCRAGPAHARQAAVRRQPVDQHHRLHRPGQRPAARLRPADPDEVRRPGAAQGQGQRQHQVRCSPRR